MFLKILLIHNEYGKFSGEEAVVDAQVELLESNSHEVVHFTRSSAEISQMNLGRLRAFFSGIYSFSSKRQVRALLAEEKPDIVHVHNVFPLISPSILGECRKAGVPVVMTVHNYRLVCPNGLHMPKGTLAVCERCCRGREYWCLLRNCEQSPLKSMGYFLRNYIARRCRLFLDNVTLYICLTEFQKKRLVSEGYPEERLAIVPNMIRDHSVIISQHTCQYVGFVGRISPEKGIVCLAEAARQFPRIPFKLAGDYSRMSRIVQQAPRNMAFVGRISWKEMSAFYGRSRFVVLPSSWFEGFPMALIEAMMHGKAIIASRIGGIPEIVADSATGLLFEPGKADELAEKIQYLWDQPELGRKMGRAGREKALCEYSPEKCYEYLMHVYEKAIELGPGGRNSGY